MSVISEVDRITDAVASRQSTVLRLLVAGACFVIIVGGLKIAAPIVTVILLGLLVAQSLSNVPTWLMKKGLKPGLSVLVSILFVLVGGLVLVGLFSISTARLADNLPAYQTRLSALRDNVMVFLGGRGIDVSQIAAFQPLDPNRALAAARVFLGGLASALGTSVLIILIAAVVLYEITQVRVLRQKGEQPATLAARFDEVTGESRQYIALTGLAGLIQAVVNLGILLVAGVDAPITWAVLFFFLNFIPGVGFLIALVPPALLALLETGWQSALIVVLGWWFVNLIGDNVIKPRFFVKGLDISFTNIVFSVVFWSFVLGPAGAILALPIALSLRRVAASLPGSASA
ncbi:MAG TPA: AI-2E family transporter [Gemmatimonadales bacterium]|nr:AI-2E family transporter [Gemmatimonadales bacterium]